MAPAPPDTSGPDWDALFEIAAAQAGHFTTAQAAAAGHSPQLLNHHVRRGRLRRVRRGIYRLVHYPAGEHEDLVVLWLWSERQGAFSHETALSLHGLSDALPALVHLTVPASWAARRLKVPRELVLHFADLPDADRTWFDAVPVTSTARTVRDCAADHAPLELVEQAIDEGLRDGLFVAADVAPALGYVGRGEEVSA